MNAPWASRCARICDVLADNERLVSAIESATYLSPIDKAGFQKAASLAAAQDLRELAGDVQLTVSERAEAAAAAGCVDRDMSVAPITRVWGVPVPRSARERTLKMWAENPEFPSVALARLNEGGEEGLLRYLTGASK